MLTRKLLFPLDMFTPVLGELHAQIDRRPAIQVLFRTFDTFLRKNGCKARGGQIVDASIVNAPRQHMSQKEKSCVYEQRKITQECLKNPRKLAQEDRNGRWTMKYSEEGFEGVTRQRVPISFPYFGYKDCTSIDKKYGMIRRWEVMSANRGDSNIFMNDLIPTTYVRKYGEIQPIFRKHMRPIYMNRISRPRFIVKRRQQ